MTALDKLRRQHELLSASRHELPALRLHHAFMRAAEPFRAPGMVPSGVLDALERDLIYCLLRHGAWSSAPIFAEVVADFLSREYVLSRPVSVALTQALLPLARRLSDGPKSHVPADDDEFLRYVCVASATATSEAEVVLDLGFGAALLGRIKETVRLLVTEDQPDAADSRRFLPAIDAQISGILCALGNEMKKMPWALQIHRLRYHLIGIGEPWRGLLREHGAGWIFELLLALGTRGGMNLRLIAAKTAKVGVEDPAALMAALAGFHLVFAARDADRWQPLPLALELTADAFARNLFNSPASPWSKIPTLPAAYQAGVVRAWPDASAADLMSLLLKTRPLAPAALAAALARLVDAAGPDETAETVAALLQGEASPWLRLAVCEALEGISTHLPVEQVLAEVARFDASAAVQAAALRASLRHAPEELTACSRGASHEAQEWQERHDDGYASD